MRTSFLIVSALVLTAACGDKGETTSPLSRDAIANPRISRTQDYPPGPNAPAAYPPGPNAPAAYPPGPNAPAAYPPGPGASAKPTPGFSTVSSVSSALATLNWQVSTVEVAIATCPAGSVVVGGGYEFTYGFLTSYVAYNGPFGTNAWRVVVAVSSAANAAFKATAMCIQ